MVLRTAEFHSISIEISVFEHSVLSIKVNWGSLKKFSAYQVCTSHWIERLLVVERLSFPEIVLLECVIIVIQIKVYLESEFGYEDVCYFSFKFPFQLYHPIITHGGKPYSHLYS